MFRELPIFVYGSLREGFFNYDKYLQGKVSKKIDGKIKGKLYHMPYKKYPALLKGEDIVYGEIMYINDYKDTIKALDQLEGYHGSNNISNEYEKNVVQVEEIISGNKIECYLYAYNLNNDKEFKDKAIYIQHGDWKKFMK